jgi:hypothetical protein
LFQVEQLSLDVTSQQEKIKKGKGGRNLPVFNAGREGGGCGAVSEKAMTSLHIYEFYFLYYSLRYLLYMYMSSSDI